MFKNLSPRAIGIRDVPLAQAIVLAGATGFAGIDFDIREAAALAGTHGVDAVRQLFADAGVRPGQWGLPVAWRDDAQWQADLERLPDLAALGVALGCSRTSTFMPSGSDERPYAENFAWHVERFRPIARALNDHGCRFGIEFLGPRTYRAQFRHEFIHTLDGLLDLAREIGTGNVGVLLDSWHLYTSGGDLSDLDRLTARDVVVVHVNDAPAGVPRDEQIDTVRELPLATGVIDLPGFIGKLQAMGYDGPVTVEPFNQALDAIARTDAERAARLVARSLDRLWQAAGLG